MHRQCPVQLTYFPWEHMAADVFLCEKCYRRFHLHDYRFVPDECFGGSYENQCNGSEYAY